jgi:hypothetical protein
VAIEHQIVSGKANRAQDHQNDRDQFNRQAVKFADAVGSGRKTCRGKGGYEWFNASNQFIPASIYIMTPATV